MILALQEFSSTEIVTIIAAFSGLLGAFGAMVINIIAAIRQGSAMKENTQLTREISKEASVIAGHVNSRATADVAKIGALEHEVAILERSASTNREIASLLAQSKVQQPGEPTPVEIVNKPSAPVPVTEA